MKNLQKMKKLFLSGIAALLLATGAAHAETKADTRTFYVASCLEYVTPEADGDDCVVTSMLGQGLEGCELMRKLLLEQKFIISRCARTVEKAKADPELARAIANRPQGGRL
jgi:hypothetical protein